MTEPAHVSVSLSAYDRKGLAKLHLIVLYGERGEKEALLQLSVSGIPLDPGDHTFQKTALSELIEALEAWRDQGGHISPQQRGGALK